jgi:hypothetical protein
MEDPQPMEYLWIIDKFPVIVWAMHYIETQCFALLTILYLFAMFQLLIDSLLI